MPDNSEWIFPSDVQPKPEQLGFELQARLDSVVRVRSEIPDNAFTAPALGTERSGNGVAINAAGRSVVLTIGYLITEASNIWITTHDGRELPGHPLAYDAVTGFGLVMPLGTLNIPTIELGNSQALNIGNDLIIIGHGGRGHSLSSALIARREFAGYWEYLLEEALFVTPPHPEWGGAALIDMHGKLVGLGSLLVQEFVSDDQFDVNMFIPISLLTPIIDEMINTGTVARAARPWLGMYSVEQEGKLVVMGMAPAGPAAEAQLRRGDVITHVGQFAVLGLAQFYRSLWAQGNAGSVITLRIQRGQRSREVQLHSASRDQFLRRPVAH